MSAMMLEHDGRASIKPRSRRWLWITLCTVFIFMPLGMWRCAREIRPSFPSFLVVVDQTFVSPNGTNAVRVSITSGGATGYGGISVYRYSKWLGYEEIFSAHPAVGLGGTYSVTWQSENEILLKYEDPHASNQDVDVKIPIAP